MLWRCNNTVQIIKVPVSNEWIILFCWCPADSRKPKDKDLPSYPPKGATLSEWQQRYHTIIQGASSEKCCHSQPAASQTTSSYPERSHRCSGVIVTAGFAALSRTMSHTSHSRRSNDERRGCHTLSAQQTHTRRRKVKRINWEQAD